MGDLDQEDAPPSQFHLFFPGAKPDLDEILIFKLRADQDRLYLSPESPNLGETQIPLLETKF